MIFTATPLQGAWMIDIEPGKDKRGFLRALGAGWNSRHGG
jgi:hypothetical protein